MYTATSRSQTLAKLTSIIKDIPEVEALILVGSGAAGFYDDLSDIDLCTVLKEPYSAKIAWDKINRVVAGTFIVIKNQLNEYGESDFLSVILLDDFLQLDIGVLSFDKLKAKRDRWIVLFEKTGRVDKRMSETWNSRRKPDVLKVYRENTDIIWYYAQNATFAIKRNQLYRALEEISVIRTKALEIICAFFDLEVKHYRDVDKLSSEIKLELQKTYGLRTDKEALGESLKKTIEFYIFATKVTGNIEKSDQDFLHKTLGFTNEVLRS